MASKSAQQETEKAEVIEEALDNLDHTVDRVKVLYEQYFLGIQKQPPTFIHSDVERKIREIAQLQIRNTALRYRFAMLQQKIGSYNSYWRRTVRQIENGTYARNLSKIGRQAAKTGNDIPEEILAAMPKRMREQVRRDREAAIAIEARRSDRVSGAPREVEVPLAPLDEADAPASSRRGVYVLDECDPDLDVDACFAAITDENREPTGVGPPPQPEPARPVLPAIPKPPAAKPPINQTIKLGTIAPPIAAQRATPPKPPAPRSSQRTLAPADVPLAPVSPPPRPSAAMPRSGSATRIGLAPPTGAPSQVTRPIPIVAGESTKRPSVPVETLSGPFRREPTQRLRRDAIDPPAAPSRPPGMTDADVNTLYAKYVKAKEMLGETTGPGAYGKLLKTINQQAPKIMEQYKAKSVEFSVVVKDKQVIIRAKPKP